MQTPLESYLALAKSIGVPKLYFKREDLHPYQSHKGRSVPVMIDHYCALGDQYFGISSSGNAALAAALHVKALNNKNENPVIKLDIFVGQHVAPHKAQKLKVLSDDNIRVILKERPLQALTQAIGEGARSLRQSTDDMALTGYTSLAEELSASKKPSAVFIGTSSGTTAQALAKYFLNNKINTQVHIVQTPSCHPMAQEFETYDGSEETSIADAIVDNVAHRKMAVVELVRQTHGYGWTVTNDEITYAQELVGRETGLKISTNSALSVAGLLKATSIGYDLPHEIVCMICGD